MHKEIGIVGLGKMGGNMAKRMAEKGWKVVGLDHKFETAKGLESEGVTPVQNYAEMIAELQAPRVVWLLVPAGEKTDEAIFAPGGLADSLSTGDTIIDGGNSFFKDALARGKKLNAKEIHFLDVGTSGGPKGARNG